MRKDRSQNTPESQFRSPSRRSRVWSLIFLVTFWGIATGAPANAAIDLTCDYGVDRMVIDTSGNILSWLRLEQSLVGISGQNQTTVLTDKGKKRFLYLCKSANQNPNFPKPIGETVCREYLTLLTVAKSEGTRVRLELDSTLLTVGGQPVGNVDHCGQLPNWTSVEDALVRLHVYNEPPDL